MKRSLFALACAAMVCALASGASAQDVVKVAIGQRGNWDTSVSELGQRAGIFRKHGIKLEIVYTQGADEALRALMLGNADIAVAAGTTSVVAAYAKGAPLRIVGAQMTGASDLYWYAKAGSPVRSFKDVAGKTVAYSAVGSSTQGIVNALMRQHSVKARPVATGGPPGTLTQVMSGEIDVGWAAPPFGLDRLDREEVRIVARGNDAQAFKDRTLRVLVTMEEVLRQRDPAIGRYMKAYRETLDWMYVDSAALGTYASWLEIPQARAKRIRDDFFPKAALDPDSVAGLELTMKDAVALKFMSVALAPAQLRDLLRISPR